MSVPQRLLSTTAVATTPQWSLLELREYAFLYIDQGRPQDAIRFLCHVFFHTPYEHARESRKIYLVKVVWNKTEAYYHQYFCDTASNILKLAQEATDAEWANDNLVKLSDTIIDQLKPELTEELLLAKNFGKASVIAQMVLDGTAALSEMNLKSIAECLRV
jgi:hypothetical protein